MIEEAIIYSVAFVLVGFLLFRYLTKCAEIEAEATIAKAQAYAGAQRAGYIAENSAMNYGNEGQGGLGDIGSIVSLLSNPALQPILQKFMTKKE